jgi:hypothetical protein
MTVPAGGGILEPGLNVAVAQGAEPKDGSRRKSP